MSKISKKDLAKRKSEMTARARAEVAKTEIVQFRVDAESIQKLYDCAAKLKMPVGTMVRQWVMDRLAVEQNGELCDTPQAYVALLNSLHARFDRFEEIIMSEKQQLS